MGIGAEGEACVVVAQHTADRFHVDAVLEGDRGKGVSEAVQGDVLQVGIFENLLMKFRYGVGVVHLSGGRGGEHVRVIRMLAVLLAQEVDRYSGQTRGGQPVHLCEGR